MTQSTRPLLWFTVALLLALAGAGAQAAVCRASPTGTGDGSTWAQAASLPAALADAACTEIWLAQGSYSQTASADGFRIERDLALYGGFAGTEGALSERPAPVNASATVLDGQGVRRVLHLDGTTPGSPITASTVIDGLSIANGHGQGSNHGGGLLCDGPCSPRITRVVFRDNLADGYGGALYNRTMSSPHISHSTFSGNRAGLSGGAIYNWALGSNASPTITQSSFHDNHAASFGGAIYNDGIHFSISSPVISHTTFSGNTASEGGALYSVAGPGSTSAPQVTASIFWGNTTTGPQIRDITDANTTVSHSIVEGGFAGVGNLALDPELGPLQDNGGSTPTRMPGITGSAIDAMDCAVTGATTDQRGTVRPQGSQCDIGAVERRLGSYPLNIGITGHGAVAGGLSPCATTTAVACAFTYTDESAPLHVTLTATPGAGQAFAGWGGDCTGTGAACTVAIDRARSVSASFAPIGPGPGAVQPVPTLSASALALLSALVGLLALWRRGA